MSLIISIKQVARNVAETDRMISQWVLPDEANSLLDFGWVGSFTQLATASTTKVNTYQVYIERVRDDG